MALIIATLMAPAIAQDAGKQVTAFVNVNVIPNMKVFLSFVFLLALSLQHSCSPQSADPMRQREKREIRLGNFLWTCR